MILYWSVFSREAEPEAVCWQNSFLFRKCSLGSVKPSTDWMRPAHHIMEDYLLSSKSIDLNVNLTQKKTSSQKHPECLTKYLGTIAHTSWHTKLTVRFLIWKRSLLFVCFQVKRKINFFCINSHYLWRKKCAVIAKGDCFLFNFVYFPIIW